MPMICTLCQEPTNQLIHEIEHAVMEGIRADHPDWVESTGGCQKCVDLYRNFDAGLELVPGSSAEEE